MGVNYDSWSCYQVIRGSACPAHVVLVVKYTIEYIIYTYII